MTTKSRQARNSRATRAMLVRAARNLFAKRGYADTATEDVVRRARVTRGALYHHFKDKQDLFMAVFQEEHRRLAAMAAESASKQSDPWSALMAGCDAFLEACLDPEIRQIVLIDAPAVLGAEGWREADQSVYLASVKAGIKASIDAGLITPLPVDPLAHMILGSYNEAALVISHAQDKQTARRQVGEVAARIWNSLRIKR
jgi:AcrR family transcriptional regulator